MNVFKKHASLQMQQKRMACAPVRRRQFPPPGISKASAAVRRRQYPTLGISKASPAVRRSQYPPPEIKSLSSSPPSPISLTRHIEGQCPSLP
ncbi:hypothetical protein PoB_005141400 [Plakobranchus ocellatus]|uniref:Uncharacterized protein n=1 Tax=Plakobranchus ocellatus TaxID=259542 RepID=A0AAV4C1B1_9GAST|nr:hypothetical protein PoB_005141400 [Plakobranchus ocellatus]